MHDDLNGFNHPDDQDQSPDRQTPPDEVDRSDVPNVEHSDAEISDAELIDDPNIEDIRDVVAWADIEVVTPGEPTAFAAAAQRHAQTTTPTPKASERPAGCLATTWVLFIVLLVAILTPMLVEQTVYSFTRGKARAEAEVARELLETVKSPESRFPFVAEVIAPSVVGIQTTSPNGQSDGLIEEGFFHGPRRVPILKGQGTGIIISEEGYILTNYHVIHAAQELSVQLADGRESDNAQVVGIDPITDLALLKVDLTGLIPIQWGDSQKLRVGDPVLAVGSPYGLSKSVTSGIISAKDRYDALDSGPSYQEFLQTDAPINPGNSGGPLVDMQGRVVGINTAIYGDSYQGIGFAIPSHIAQRVADQLRVERTVSHGWLGVRMLPVTDEAVKQLKLDSTTGAIVAQLVPNSPAVDAGILPNDVIVAWNEEPIRQPGDLSHAVIRTPVNSIAKLGLIREGRPINVDIKVGTRPAF